ncbi:uncharacterized protein [Anabrus simplex]|uniref:uncharacterized protein n=1 Tax=Anabrus simplex TaxID=316456 RepID=UPI0035A3A6F1
MKSPPGCCILLFVGCLFLLGTSIVSGHESDEEVFDTAASDSSLFVKRVIHSPALPAGNAHVDHCNSCGKHNCNCHDNNKTKFLRGRRGRAGERRTGGYHGTPARSVLRMYPDSTSHRGSRGKATRTVYVGLGTHGLGGTFRTTGLGKGVLIGGTYGLEGILGTAGLGTYGLGGTVGFSGLGTHGLGGTFDANSHGTHGLGGFVGTSYHGTHNLGGIFSPYGYGTHRLGGIGRIYSHDTHGLGALVTSSGHGTHGLGGLVTSSGHGTHGFGGIVGNSGHLTHGLGGLVTSSGHGSHSLGEIVDTYGHGTHGLGGLVTSSSLGGISGHTKGLIGVAKYPGSRRVMTV